MEINEKVDNRYNNFRLFCSQINESNINVFRSNNFFRSIVENVNNDYGNQYYKHVIENYNDYLDLNNVDWKELENVMKIGNPLVMDNYVINNETYEFSPTVMRYFQFTLDMFKHIKEKEITNELNVVEIGGGFGCQAALFCYFAKFFDIKVKTYTIIDLEEVCNLQKHYVKAVSKTLHLYDNNIKSITSDQYNNNYDTNFVLSNYALGELNSYWQDFYINTIIKKSDNGYFCWNFSPANPTIHEYFKSIDNLIKQEENPQTNCPPVKSYILRY